MHVFEIWKKNHFYVFETLRDTKLKFMDLILYLVTLVCFLVETSCFFQQSSVLGCLEVTILVTSFTGQNCVVRIFWI
jgi:hypothetical protein